MHRGRTYLISGLRVVGVASAVDFKIEGSQVNGTTTGRP